MRSQTEAMETLSHGKTGPGQNLDPPFLDDEKPREEWLDRLDSVLTWRYTVRGSFGAALAEIVDSMDWRVDACARDAKPWLSPMELLDGATDSYEDCDHD